MKRKKLNFDDFSENQLSRKEALNIAGAGYPPGDPRALGTMPASPSPGDGGPVDTSEDVWM